MGPLMLSVLPASLLVVLSGWGGDDQSRHASGLLADACRLLVNPPFVTLFLVLGCGYLVGRIKLGMFSFGSTAGTLLVGLIVGAVAFSVTGLRFGIPDLVGTIFLSMFTYAIGLRVGPQFVQGLRDQGWQLIVLVMVTTTASAAIVVGGSRLSGLGPGFAPGMLSGANTVSAVMGVATSAVNGGLYTVPAGTTAAVVNANIAAGYSLTYILSILGIVLLIRNLPAMFGIDPVAAAKESEKKYGARGDAAPGTADAFKGTLLPLDVRVFELTNPAGIGLPVIDLFERLDLPVLRVARGQSLLALKENPRLQKGDLVTVFGDVVHLVAEAAQLGPEVADPAARLIALDQAEIVLTQPRFDGATLQAFHESRPAYGLSVRALFRGGHELPLLPLATLRRHDVLRVVGPAESIRRAGQALGDIVRPTDVTSMVTLALGMALGYLIGLITIPVAGIPVGLGAMGGVVVAGMAVSTMRTWNPYFGGPMREGARAFLEGIGVDLFVATLGLNVAPDLLHALSQGRSTLAVLVIGLVAATLPAFLAWLVGLYILKMDPIVLAGAVAGSRNSTTAMRAISDESKSAMPAFGYPVPYALSTVVFLIYGYLALMLS